MPKRTNGEGTIYQTKDGLWRAEITLGYDADNKRIKKTRSSKDLEVVQKWLNDERFKLQRNIIAYNNDYTVSEWLTFWLENYKIHSIKPKTYDSYESNFKRYIIPQIGDMRLNKIKGEIIQQTYNQMYKKGLSTSTIKNTHIPLNQAFEQAITNELIYTNPCKKVNITKREKRKAKAFTAEEQERLIDTCTGTTFHNFFIFALNTGMRCGEIMALTWNDIDFLNMIISVNKTASLIVNRDEGATTKSKIVLNVPKTEKSARKIPINNNAYKVLEALNTHPCKWQ